MAERVKLRVDALVWDGHEIQLCYEDPLPDEDVYRTRQRLRDVLREVSVPVTALAAVQNTLPHRNRVGVIRLVPRAHASPFHQVAGVGIIDAVNPLIIGYSAKSSLLAEYYVTEIRRAIHMHGLADTPADEFAIAVPNPLEHLTADDAFAEIDDHKLAITWGKNARREKTQGKRQQIVPLDSIHSIRYVPDHSIRYVPDDLDPDGIGYIQITPTGTTPATQPHPTEDPHSILLFSSEQFADGMLFAAHLATLTPARFRAANKTGEQDVVDNPVDELRTLLRLRDTQQISHQDFEIRKWKLFRGI
ncbi:uncharacterized protein DUF4429 [Actinomadura pelletieri DSM 43383]|uniref:Uncharacterized protein DUF4429 n=1 Tax=Actinomadura pelletieri DSM 43383 TaxID=1120940 RepID=A0A495QBC2_9ACTN|nr:DUF4429 domain-containing protein [Actinomadura pelletieri]RKS68983.1 uncharacterized protein DUF4429 [Actinomadura pelletieri DSM 43383]